MPFHKKLGRIGKRTIKKTVRFAKETTPKVKRIAKKTGRGVSKGVRITAKGIGKTTRFAKEIQKEFKQGKRKPRTKVTLKKPKVKVTKSISRTVHFDGVTVKVTKKK